jgi:Rad3-related DNA helicase
MTKGINPCIYYKNRDAAQRHIPWDPLDIEELHKLAKESSCMFCPYFAMKDRVNGADVIFMPYNYLVDEKIRENFDINFENSIIIFDEAHNITQTCEDIASFQIETNHLEKVVNELNEIKDAKAQNEDKVLASTEEDIQHIKLMVSGFMQYLQNYDLMYNKDKIDITNNFLSKKSCVLPGKKIFEIIFFGTKFSSLDVKTQEERTFTLKQDFEEIK